MEALINGSRNKDNKICRQNGMAKGLNVIFLTLANFTDISVSGIYTDLIQKFRNEGHEVFIVSPSERRKGESTRLIKTDGVKILKVRTLNIQKTNVVEKGIGTLLIERQYRQAIRKHLGDISFDLILYSTPPITFTNVIKYLKQRNPRAISYLLLKDIFPQNAVDIGFFSKRSLFWWFFRKKEKSLYKASDFIGCMSPANVAFIRRHNPTYPGNRIEVAPNSIELREKPVMSLEEIVIIRKKYNLPNDRPIFIYGGNLGKPQGIDYIIKCMEANKNREDCLFLIIGSGTEYSRLQVWYENCRPHGVRLMQGLPKNEYEGLLSACDVGMIFLDHRFTIPNYPSRLLSYLENRMPVICATDKNTDIGQIAEKNGYGFWCESVKAEDFTAMVDRMLLSDFKAMGGRGYEFLKANYLVEQTYNTVVRHLQDLSR